MYIESRKINIIEAVLKLNSEETLIKLEEVLKTVSNNIKTKKNKHSIFNFVGTLSDKEAMEMKKAINETCETIDPNDWK